MNNDSYKTLQKNFENKVANEETGFHDFKSIKNYSNRVDSWYLEKNIKGKFILEYFGSVEERKQFFRKCKNIKISSESLDQFINGLCNK